MILLNIVQTLKRENLENRFQTRMSQIRMTVKRERSLMNRSQKLQTLILVLVRMNSNIRSTDHLEIVNYRIDWPILLHDIQ